MISKNLKGFTLIEFVVTMVIFTLLTTLTFSSYPQLNLATGFNTAARDLHNVLKSAQITGSSRGGDYSGDGIYLNLTNPTGYKIFSDINNAAVSQSLGTPKGDRLYVEVEDQKARSYLLLNGMALNDLCVINQGEVNKDCSSDSLSINYSRPSTKAHIANYLLDINGKIKFYDKAYIEMKRDAAANPFKCIIVYKFGQIELKEGSCTLY